MRLPILILSFFALLPMTASEANAPLKLKCSWEDDIWVGSVDKKGSIIKNPTPDINMHFDDLAVDALVKVDLPEWFKRNQPAKFFAISHASDRQIVVQECDIPNGMTEVEYFKSRKNVSTTGVDTARDCKKTIDRFFRIDRYSGKLEVGVTMQTQFFAVRSPMELIQFWYSCEKLNQKF